MNADFSASAQTDFRTAAALVNARSVRQFGHLGRVGLLAFCLANLFDGGCGAQQRPDGGQGMLPVGAQAPDLVGRDVSGKDSRLSDQRGHASVVYFYPKDETPGCTKEACAFRDTWNRFQAHNVAIFGVSRDSAASHEEFLKKHELPFPLVADESGAIQNAYGVPSRLGKAARVSFLIDGHGRVARVWPDVDPAVHADEVLHAVDELAKVSPGG
jgi:peroxiredoxin Q/BCP